jgi:hypothetical protein
MPSPPQPLITLPLSDRLYLYIYMYSAKCLTGIKENKKTAAKIEQFRRIKGKLTFKLNVSTKLY